MILNHFQVCNYKRPNCEASINQVGFQLNNEFFTGEGSDFLIESPPTTIMKFSDENNETTGAIYVPKNLNDIDLSLDFVHKDDQMNFLDVGFSSITAPPQTSIIPCELQDSNEVHQEDSLAKKLNLRKGRFTDEDDELLKNLVSKHGHDWALIAKLMSNKDRKQVRERYNNYLSKNLSLRPFTPEEDKKMVELVEKFGTKFFKIAEFFEGRSPIMIKNRYHTKFQKKKKRCAGI